MNCVWYWRVQERDSSGSDRSPSSDGFTLEELLTDKRGTTHRASIAPGLLSSFSFNRILEIARTNVPPPFAELFALAGQSGTFVQAIMDSAPTPLVSHGGRVVLLGDAACVVRPHTAAGTLKCGEDADALSRVVGAWTRRRLSGLPESPWLEDAMRRGYETERTEKNSEIARFGVEVGDRLLGFDVGRAGETERVAPSWK